MNVVTHPPEILNLQQTYIIHTLCIIQALYIHCALYTYIIHALDIHCALYTYIIHTLYTYIIHTLCIIHIHYTRIIHTLCIIHIHYTRIIHTLCIIHIHVPAYLSASSGYLYMASMCLFVWGKPDRQAMECAVYCTNAHAHAQTHTLRINNTHIPLHNTTCTS